MRAAVVRDTTAREISIRIEDGPELDVTEPWHKKPRIVVIDRVTIRVVDGETRYLKAVGGVRLKNGDVSLAQRDDRGWGGYDRTIDKAPAWAQRFWREAPVGVTEWLPPRKRVPAP